MHTARNATFRYVFIIWNLYLHNNNNDDNNNDVGDDDDDNTSYTQKGKRSRYVKKSFW